MTPMSKSRQGAQQTRPWSSSPSTQPAKASSPPCPSWPLQWVTPPPSRMATNPSKEKRHPLPFRNKTSSKHWLQSCSGTFQGNYQQDSLDLFNSFTSYWVSYIHVQYKAGHRSEENPVLASVSQMGEWLWTSHQVNTLGLLQRASC